MKKVCITNQKGGTGKSTTAINLASCLVSLGKKTLLIDMDPQAHSTIGIGIEPSGLEKSMHDVMVTPKFSLKNVIMSSYIKNLDIAPSHIKLASGAEQMYSRMFRETILLNSMRGLEKAYKFAIIDCPPALGVLTTNALYASDFIIVPCQMSRYSLDGLADLLDTIEIVKNKTTSEQEKMQHLRILLTMFDKRNKITNEFVLKQLEPYNEWIFETIIMRNESLNQAQMAQRSIFDFEPKSTEARDYEALTKEILTYE